MKKTCLPALAICTLMSCAFSLSAEIEHEKITPQEECPLFACDADFENPAKQADAQAQEPTFLATDAACENSSQQTDVQGEVHILPYPSFA